mmetsp:Transcript_21957/g.33504  ORF Transcript_21957/g.33504 Transcript_21957/m.33504 type:complete len:177 (-) Transcript_21957:119-649(-)
MGSKGIEELALDLDSGFASGSSSLETNEQLIVKFRESQTITTEFTGHSENVTKYPKYDPSTHYEIKCPTETSDGGRISYADDGTVTVIRISSIVQSNSDGTTTLVERPENTRSSINASDAPIGSVVRVDGGFVIINETETNTRRRLLSDLPFGADVLRMCKDAAEKVTSGIEFVKY